MGLRPSAVPSAAPRGRHGGRRRELLLLATVYAGYELVRSLSPTRVDVAHANARAVEQLEAAANLDVELALNQALTRAPVLEVAASGFYQSAHLLVTGAVLLHLWRRRRTAYPLLRKTLVTVTGISLALYWLLPTAPPRFALAGAVDTLAHRPVLLAGNEAAIEGAVNLYAAMPSLHVAWSVWSALALVVTAGATSRHLAWAYPATTTLVVVATANHYVLDTAAGAALVAAVWSVTSRYWPGDPINHRQGPPPRHRLRRCTAPPCSTAG